MYDMSRNTNKKIHWNVGEYIELHVRLSFLDNMNMNRADSKFRWRTVENGTSVSEREYTSKFEKRKNWISMKNPHSFSKHTLNTFIYAINVQVHNITSEIYYVECTNVECWVYSPIFVVAIEACRQQQNMKRDNKVVIVAAG